MTMYTLDELVNAQIRDYLISEDFINKYDTEQMITDEIENRTYQYLHPSDADDKYATNEYVDEEIREQVRSTIDADAYATQEYVDAAIAEHIRTVIEAQDLISDSHVADIVCDKITALRKELYLEGLVPAEEQKPVNQGKVEWEVDDYHLERLKELGLDSDDKDELDIISRI